jgi:hypothetical protein
MRHFVTHIPVQSAPWDELAEKKLGGYCKSKKEAYLCVIIPGTPLTQAHFSGSFF